MSDTTVKAQRTAEPRADYAIQVQSTAGAARTTATSTATTATGPNSRTRGVAVAVRVDEDGQQFDKHDVRIGRWEAEPCGNDCIPNILMASYAGMLVLWLVLYVLSTLSTAIALAYSTMDVEYGTKYYGGYNHKLYSYKYVKEDPLAGLIISSIVSCATSVAWLLANTMLRVIVRERFALPGNCFCDCCCVLWCPWCSLMQLATHVKSYKPGSCSFVPDVEALDALPAYDDGETTTSV